MLHGLPKDSDVAIQIEYVSFENLNSLVWGFPESGGYAKILSSGYKGNVLDRARGGNIDEIVVLGLLGNER